MMRKFAVRICLKDSKSILFCEKGCKFMSCFVAGYYISKSAFFKGKQSRQDQFHPTMQKSVLSSEIMSSVKTGKDCGKFVRV